MLIQLTTIAISMFFAGSAIAQSLERSVPDCASEAVAKARDDADRGDVASIYLMARYFSTGKCVPGNGAKAVELYWQAAKLNYPPAFYNLGIVAAGGEGDFQKAELMFFRGMQLGHRGAELQLGILYQLAPAPVRDLAEAYAWLSVTAARGESISREARDLLTELDRKVSNDERERGKSLAISLSGQFSNVPPFSF
jgi:TPR repeat protein